MTSNSQDPNLLYCFGHLRSQNNRCHDCKADKYNSMCPDFVPITIRTFEVRDETPKREATLVEIAQERHLVEYVAKYNSMPEEDGFDRMLI